jgi:FMN-dependent NADH-azoreductase
LQFSDQEARIEALKRAHAELAGVAADWAAWERARVGSELHETA